jgi:hypothetical protein
VVLIFDFASKQEAKMSALLIQLARIQRNWLGRIASRTWRAQARRFTVHRELACYFCGATCATSAAAGTTALKYILFLVSK